MGGGGLFTGTLNLLILLSLTGGPLHGYAIGRWIRRSSQGVLGVGEGQLYPALHKLQERGWLKVGWGETETGRRAKIYELTITGRQRLEQEQESWQEYADAMHTVIASQR